MDECLPQWTYDRVGEDALDCCAPLRAALEVD